MTRLSDSLRGLADRAPVDEVTVSTSAATRRIYRGRRLRAAANATAGVGVVAVIALAAINPGIGSGDSSVASAAMADTADTSQGNKIVAPGFDAAGAGEFAWGQCGTQPFNTDVPAVSDAWSLTLGEIDTAAEPGTSVKASVTVTRSADASTTGEESMGTAFMVLWNGIVVGTAQNPGADPAIQSSTEGAVSFDAPVDLLNCWDGTPLPAGAYELVAYQDFYPSNPIPQAIDPTLPAVDPAQTPDAQVETGDAKDDRDGTDGGVADGGVATPGNTGVVGPIALTAVDRAVSNTVAFAIAGDVPDDPFGAYLSPAAPAIVYPDDYLTPTAARAEYATRAKAGVWDMAAGTQRVVTSGDATTQSDDKAWQVNYYGCSADGVSTPAFPETSADWQLLKIEASRPSSVGVSYGWVVDGNPEVKVSVTNTSGYTLPGFWGQPSNSMYLVKDGKVVAMSYLASTNQNGFGTSASTDGLLAPDANLSGTYLWRDVNGCWIGDAQATIKPGTYTVLMVQDVYLDNGNSGYGGPIAYFDGARSAASDAGGSDSPHADLAGTSAMVAPAPIDGNYDWLSLQVWTSLGQVTVK